MISKARQLIKKLNKAFVTLILIIVYFPVLGLCFLLLKISKVFKTKHSKKTYWESSRDEVMDIKFFKSAY